MHKGDIIGFNVEERQLSATVSSEEQERRRAPSNLTVPAASRGYVVLYIDHMLQANEGADMDFLVGRSGSNVLRDNFQTQETSHDESA